MARREPEGYLNKETCLCAADLSGHEDLFRQEPPKSPKRQCFHVDSGCSEAPARGVHLVRGNHPDNLYPYVQGFAPSRPARGPGKSCNKSGQCKRASRSRNLHLIFVIGAIAGEGQKLQPLYLVSLATDCVSRGAPGNRESAPLLEADTCSWVWLASDNFVGSAFTPKSTIWKHRTRALT
jgi:hypothetical protein